MVLTARYCGVLTLYKFPACVCTSTSYFAPIWIRIGRVILLISVWRKRVLQAVIAISSEAISVPFTRFEFKKEERRCVIYDIYNSFIYLFYAYIYAYIYADLSWAMSQCLFGLQPDVNTQDSNYFCLLEWGKT